MKERYRIEILDTKTKKKQIFLVNNFSQEARYDLQPIKLDADKPATMINTGFQSVSINMSYPKLKMVGKNNGKKRKKTKKSNSTGKRSKVRGRRSI